MLDLGQGYWECRRVEGTHTRDTGEKDKILSLHTCFASAPLPNLEASAGKKSSYPMHVSGHEMVEWVQRYACAKLSETVWLPGG